MAEARTELGRLVDAVALMRQASAKLEPADERALWAAVREMAEGKLAQMGRRDDHGQG